MEYPDFENESGAFDGEIYAEYVDAFAYIHDQEKDRIMEESIKKEEEKNANI